MSERLRDVKRSVRREAASRLAATFRHSACLLCIILLHVSVSSYRVHWFFKAAREGQVTVINHLKVKLHCLIVGLLQTRHPF